MSEKSKLTRKITVRFKPEEYSKVNASFRRTTKRKLSEYIRYVLLEKPVTVYTRSQSIDDLMADLILLKNELSVIGNNFNQAVKRVHTMDYKQDLKSWLYSMESIRQFSLKRWKKSIEKLINYPANGCKNKYRKKYQQSAQLLSEEMVDRTR
ncbi:MAG: plasmid mobilization relaxosome protein MobC [Ginsengibacter sp.]